MSTIISILPSQITKAKDGSQTGLHTYTDDVWVMLLSSQVTPDNAPILVPAQNQEPPAPLSKREQLMKGYSKAPTT